ncbi:MAG TPA: NTP transferase domain-containing protein [Mycobacteriales bacterium]|nr:NTP transferase domain-containing protein [Mycobacteriales bacterium]
MSSLAALLLAAGEGTRLRPLTQIRPKPLCPVGNVPLLELAARRVGSLVPITASDVAVNAHHLGEQVVEWAGDRLHVSVEQPQALGTAGAVAAVAGWLDGRDVLIANGDAFFHGDVDMAALLDGWDRERPRLVVVAEPDNADFAGGWRFAGVSLLPARFVPTLRAEPSGLYEEVWSRTDIDLFPTSTPYVDCGSPRDYLRANLMTSGGESVVDPTARVEGSVTRCVVWPGATVHADETLADCVRARGLDGEDVTVDAA